jgi:hypothetical protein
MLLHGTGNAINPARPRNTYGSGTMLRRIIVQSRAKAMVSGVQELERMIDRFQPLSSTGDPRLSKL